MKTRRLVTCGIAIVLICLTPRRVVSQDAEDQIHASYQKAQKAMLEGRYGEAEAEYQAILKLDPSLAEAHANLGIVYYLEFKYPQAAETLRHALKLRSGLSRARLYLGLAQSSLGEYQESIRSLEEALAIGLDAPYRKLAQTNLARDYLALDETEKALKVLKPLLDEFPHDADLLYTLGKAYLRLSARAAEKLGQTGDTARVHQMLAESFVTQGKWTEALDEYRAALARDPNLRGTHYPVGLLLLHQGEAEAGRRHLQAALEVDPQNIRAREFLDQLRLGALPKPVIEDALTEPPSKTGQPGGLVDHWAAASNADPRDVNLSPVLRGELLYGRGQYEDAASLFAQLKSQSPRNVDALYWLVRSYQALALSAFDRIARVAPDSARAHQLLAEGFEKQERVEQAVEEYTIALSRDPRLPGVHYAIGLSRMKMGQWQEARKEFESELALDPFNAGANFRLGQLAYRFSQYDEATRFFARATVIYPGFGEAQTQIAQVLIRRGRYQEALPHLLAATELTPADHTVHFQLYRAYRGVGEKDKAQKELEIFQRMENEKKEATLRKAAESMEQIEKSRKEKVPPPGSGRPAGPPF